MLINSELFFPLTVNTAHLRGHDLIFLKGVKLNVRKNFFTQRVVNGLNTLPETVINSTSINMFKYILDCHLMFSSGYIQANSASLSLKHSFSLIYL